MTVLAHGAARLLQVPAPHFDTMCVMLTILQIARKFCAAISRFLCPKGRLFHKQDSVAQHLRVHSNCVAPLRVARQT